MHFCTLHNVHVSRGVEPLSIARHRRANGISRHCMWWIAEICYHDCHLCGGEVPLYAEYAICCADRA